MSEISLPLVGPGGEGPLAWPDADEFRVVFLDAGNTLLFLDFEAMASVVRETGFPVEPAQIERAEYEARRLADRTYMEGGFDDASMLQQYFTWMLDATGISEGLIAGLVERLRQLHKESNLWRRPGAGVAHALKRIKFSGRKLAVISNSDGTCRAALARAGLLDHLDAVFDSSEVGFEKPDSGIFHVALGEMGARPGEALHMGDLEAIDVRGARRAGLVPVLADPFPPPHAVDFRVLRSVSELPAALGIVDS